MVGEELEARLCLDASPQFLGDLNTTPASVDRAVGLLAAEDFVYLVATDSQHGDELWRTDGTTAGTRLIKDIHPGTRGSEIRLSEVSYGGSVLTEGNVLIFVADDGLHGRELWRSDGTTDGTFLLKDIAIDDSSSPSLLRKVGTDVLFFTSFDSTPALWKTDGTTDGTVPLQEPIRNGSRGGRNSLVVNGRLVFVGDDGQHGEEIWSSDGTRGGTMMVRDINPKGHGAHYYCGHGGCEFRPTFHRGLDRVFFQGRNAAAGRRLWVTDGTANGTYQLTDRIPGYSTVGQTDSLLFFSSRSSEPKELWKSDGTPGGTALVRELPSISTIDILGAAGETIYFRGVDNSSVSELWKSDGTQQGTLRMNLNLSGGAYPEAIGSLGGTFFFSANDGEHARVLWKSNAQGTEIVTGFNTLAGRQPRPGIVLGEQLIVASQDQLWAIDESGQNATLLLDGVPTGNPKAVWQGRLLFQGRTGEIWTTDGTPEGTRLDMSAPTTTRESSPQSFVNFRGKNYFVAFDGSTWAVQAHDPVSGDVELIESSRASTISSLHVYRDRRLIFLADGQLWLSDGTSQGTRIVLATPQILEMQIVGETIFMATEDAIWKSDGTSTGTQLVAEVSDGVIDQNLGELTPVGDTVFFSVRPRFVRPTIWRSDGTAAGTFPVSVRSPGFVISDSRTSRLTAVGNILFFVMEDDNHGSELWRSDGTLSGTTLVKDIRAGSDGSYPLEIRAVGDLAVFTADDGEHGREIWTSDGTADGTNLLSHLGTRELLTGSEPDQFTRAENATYLVARGENGRRALWQIPHDQSVVPEVVADGFREVDELTIFRDRLLFVADREGPHARSLWTIDASGRATQIGPTNLQDVVNLTAVGDLVYFRGSVDDDVELWQSDGTNVGTVLVADINLHGSSSPTEFTVIGDGLYFVADDGIHGRELWQTGGATASTTLVHDVNFGIRSANPEQIKALGSSVLFVAEDYTSGRELWISDGTSEGTHQVDDLRAEVTNDSWATQYAHVGAWTYFVADDGFHGPELWRSDGTVAGTELALDLMPGPEHMYIRELHAAGDHLFFAAFNETDFHHLLAFDHRTSAAKKVRVSADGGGTDVLFPREFTVLNDDLYVTAQSGNERVLYRIEETTGDLIARQVLPNFVRNPSEFTVVGDRLFFAADGEVHGRELWQTDGTAQGTTLVADINSAVSNASSPGQFTKIGNRVFFTARNATHGAELWVTDGTPEGTDLVKDIRPGSGGSVPRELTEFDGQLVFVVNAVLLRELWISDGTAEGTRSLTGSFTTRGPIDPHRLVVASGNLFFFAKTFAGRMELWKSDGTQVGTVRVRSEGPFNDSSPVAPDQLVAMEGAVFYAADDGIHGRELWKSDGTPEGTVLVKDVRTGSTGSVATEVTQHKLVRHGSKLYFAADADGRFAAEIWVTDGTEAGTTMVHDPRKVTTLNSLPLGVVDDWLFFSSPSGDHGNELWRTNGSSNNVTLVADLSPGRASSVFFPHGEFTKVGPQRILFPALTATEGAELWVTDGTADGTYPLDLEPGSGSTDFGELVQVRVLGDFAYFFASVPSRGRGLWKSDGTLAGTELIRSATLAPWPDLTLSADKLYFGVTDPGGALADYQAGEFSQMSLQTADPSASSWPTNFSVIGDELFFVADDGVHGREAWRSDGTPEGTELVFDLWPGSGSSDPQDFTAAGSSVYFSASLPATGRELWVTSVPTSETRLVSDTLPGPLDSDPSNFVAWDGKLVFTADAPSDGRVLWVTDGTANGTRSLTELFVESAFHNPRDPVVLKNQLFVSATSSDRESLMWRFDAIVTRPLQLAKGVVSSTLHAWGDQLYFTGFDTHLGWEPWVSDGTSAGSHVVADVNRTNPGSDPHSFTIHNGKVYFLADDGRGQELWQSDGSADGTRVLTSVVADLTLGTTLSFQLAATGLYVVRAGASGRELWKVDLELAEAVQIWSDADAQRYVETIGVVDDKLFFRASQSAFGTELWVTDGTRTGTKMVRDIFPGSGSTDISNWAKFANGFVFLATEPSRGRELWFTDGTPAGTDAIADIRPGPQGSEIDSIRVADDVVYFSANDGVHGVEPWVTDGTAAGTSMLFNIDARTFGSSPSGLTINGSELFFTATSEQTSQLWRWSAGLDAPELVSAAVADPTELVVANDTLFFSGRDQDLVRRLWASNGSAARTRLLTTANTDQGYAPQSITAMEDGSIYFSAVDSVHGREAWWLPSIDGDTDGDRDVDFLDFLRFASHFGQHGSRHDGDFDGNGVIDFADFLLLAQNFG